ncbi:MAG: hypothetical protein ACPGAN_07040 [Candidatus Poseidoniaceae archaeon]
MVKDYIQAIKSSIPISFLIGLGASFGAAVLTLGIGMDTPWIPWDPSSGIFYSPRLFILASFIETIIFLPVTVIFLKILEKITPSAIKIWRISGIIFLAVCGLLCFGAGTTQAGIMLNILHSIVGIPALILIPSVLDSQNTKTNQQLS